MFNILVCFILILDIFILIDSRLRHTILYLMIFQYIVSYRVCIWLLIILSLHVASHQDAYCTCQITSCCIGAYYVISWNVLYGTILYTYYTSLKQDSLHHVILPKINYKIKRHTVLCTLKILHSIIMLVYILSCALGLREIQHCTTIICYMFCTVYVPYIPSCVLKYMGLYHTSSYYFALCYLILINRIISICVLTSYQSLMCHIIFC